MGVGEVKGSPISLKRKVPLPNAWSRNSHIQKQKELGCHSPERLVPSSAEKGCAHFSCVIRQCKAILLPTAPALALARRGEWLPDFTPISSV
jgi:hypothetical protein